MAFLSAGAAAIPVRPDMRAFGNETRKGVDEAGKGAAAGLGKAFVGALAAAGIGAAVGAAFGKALDGARLNDKLAASLGSTPAVAKKHGEIASRVYAGAWGESMEEVNTAIGSVASAFPKLGKKAGPELERLTQKALDFSGIFDVDVPRAMGVASTVVKSGLAKNGTEALDLLTRSAQKVPANLREGVLDAAEEYSGFFSTLGIKGPQAFGLLVKGAEKGQYGIDKVGDAIKEFTIRATDGSDASNGAFKAIGLDAGKMTNSILAGGKKSNKAFGQIIDGLLRVKDPGKQAQTALALFGTPLEDLNVKEIPSFLQGLKDGSKGLDNWRGATKRAGDTLNDNASTRLTAFKRGLETNVVNFLGNTVIPKLETFGQWFQTKGAPAVRRFLPPLLAVGTWIRENAPVVGTFVAILAGFLIINKIVKAVAALNIVLAANPIGLVVLAIAALAAGLVYAYKKSETFRRIVDAAWAGIKHAVRSAWVGFIRPALAAFHRFVSNVVIPVIRFLWRNVIAPTFRAIGSLIRTWWNVIVKPAFAALRWYFSKVLFPVIRFLWNHVVKPVFRSVADRIRATWDIVRPILRAFGNFITDKVAPAFRRGVDAVGKAWGRIKAVASRPVNFVIDTVYNNGLRSMFNTVAGKLGMKTRLPYAEPVGGAGRTAPAIGGAGRRAAFGGAGRSAHAHPEAMGGPFSFVKNAVGNPFDWFKDKVTGGVDGLLDGVGSGPFADMAGAAVRKVAGFATDFLKGKFSSASATAAGPKGKAGRVLPAGSYRIGMPYLGYPGHYGADYPAPAGTPVSSPWAGRVSKVASLTSSYGKHIYVDHGNGVQTRYAHLSALGVKAGQQILPGGFLGRVGSTGNSTGNHLHFEYRRNGSPSNPAGLGIFDSGGMLPTGLSAVFNGTGKPEAVFTADQLQTLERIANHGAGGFPSRAVLVVDGYEFNAYVDARADGKVTAARELDDMMGRAD
jgi:phage-related minor tail protein